MGKVKISISLDAKLVETIDKHRGIIKRSTFIEDLLYPIVMKRNREMM